MRPRLGLMVDDLSPSHLSWALMNSANALARSGRADVCIFYEDLVKPSVRPELALLPAVHATGFEGVLVATGLHTAARLAKLPAPAKKLFYCWDLEWQRIGQKDYAGLIALYRSSSYRLVARTVEHARLLSQLWNRSVVDVVPEADARGLLGVGLDG
jgi:hypothetical protein